MVWVYAHITISDDLAFILMTIWRIITSTQEVKSITVACILLKVACIIPNCGVKTFVSQESNIYIKKGQQTFTRDLWRPAVGCESS